MTTVALSVQRGPALRRQFTQSWVGGVKRSRPVGSSTFSRQTLPSEAVGIFALTLTGLIPGSAVQVESGSTVFHFSIVASSTLLINLQAYAAGSALNNLVIKVRKGSGAPFYQPYSTQATAIVGAQSIFVSQIEDQ